MNIKLDRELNQIELDVKYYSDNYMTGLIKKIIDLENKMITDALIAMGWTPPKGWGK